jgi:hypothetical protein
MWSNNDLRLQLVEATIKDSEILAYDKVIYIVQNPAMYYDQIILMGNSFITNTIM